MQEKVISVWQLNSLLKQIIDAEELLSGILISGEVTNFKVSGNHAYFNLKDDKATIFCTYFNYKISNREFDIKNNDLIIAKGKPDFYAKGGSLSFKVTRATPEGLGALYQKFLELKEKLSKEGLFDESHKKPIIPSKIKRIGVVTSPTGAVIRDIINVTKRRNPYVDIVLFPVKVQGEGADVDIAKGVYKLDVSKLVDVIIVGRGGGSQEDLMCFNSELVARAVYNCETPIISAVGHETDFSLSDFASDLRAPTPSAAAELSTQDVLTEVKQFLKLANSLKTKENQIFFSKQTALIHSLEKVKLLSLSKTENARNLIIKNLQNATHLIKNIYVTHRSVIRENMAKLDGQNPLKLLNKGYAKVNVEGKAITSIKNINTGDTIQTQILDGTIVSKVVTKIEEGEKV